MSDTSITNRKKKSQGKSIGKTSKERKNNEICSDCNNATNNGCTCSKRRRNKLNLKDKVQTVNGTMYRYFGFEMKDFQSWQSFVGLLNRPTDASSLGMLRFVFGLLMFLDVFHERGLHIVDYIYGDPEECRFPMFDFLKPMPLEYMYIVYFCMILGALGIMVGFMFKISTLVFILTYWYIFLLDKTTWNNHSYLYGLTAILLFFSDANRYWSIDGVIWPQISNSHVPLWNYSVFRIQFFLVYFIAGLKKLDMDWVLGYSMNKLSSHWVFTPFTPFLSEEAIDLYIVHLGGLALDLTLGYLLFFDYTRPLGVLFGGSFHVMNSQMFAIGMFPYTMLATMPIFCHTDWPKKLPGPFGKLFVRESPQPSDHCIYSNNKDTNTNSQENVSKFLSNKQKNVRKEGKESSTSSNGSSSGLYHELSSVFVIVYVLIQCLLPWSHGITLGYNNWTNGLYGYSWDMMVHNWSTQHIRITYHDRSTGKTGFLNPEAWTRGRDRWSSHTDMIKQYGTCIEDRLRQYNLTDVELYFDVWRSLNDRFQQRMVDPRVDILTAPWSPFEKTPWLMDLLTNLSDWRGKLDEIEKEVYKGSNMTEVVFIADVPGLYLENYIQKDLGNTTIHLLHGKVIVELVEAKANVTLNVGDKLKLPVEKYHKVHTLPGEASCYMYIFMNTTEAELSEKFIEAEKNDGKGLSDKEKVAYEDMQKARNDLQMKVSESWLSTTAKQMATKYKNVYRGLTMLRVAVQSIITGDSFELVFNQTVIRTNHNDQDNLVYDANNHRDDNIESTQKDSI